MDPDESTVPIPGSIATVVASLTSQLKSVFPPSEMTFASAEKELIVGLVGVGGGMGRGVNPPQPDKNINSKVIRKYLK